MGGKEKEGRGGEGRGGKRGEDVEGPGKWSAPGPVLALGGPDLGQTIQHLAVIQAHSLHQGCTTSTLCECFCMAVRPGCYYRQMRGDSKHSTCLASDESLAYDVITLLSTLQYWTKQKKRTSYPVSNDGAWQCSAS